MSSTGYLSELDALRNQIANLSRQLAERDCSTQDSWKQSEMLRAIVEGTATETGEEFFAALVIHLTAVLRVQYAVIGEVQGDHIKKMRTLVVSSGGTLVDNFEYELAQAPCAIALTRAFVCFDRDLQATFPQFQRLADLGAESYCAASLRTQGGAVIGLLVMMDTKPFQQVDYLQSVLEVFAPRVTVEFERRRSEQEKTQALDDLHNVIETIPDIMFALDTRGNLVKWNRRLGDVTGYSSEELLNKPALAFVPPEEQTRTAAAIQRVFMEGYAELEGHLLTKDHRLIPYHWTGGLLKNTQGEPIGITGIGRDVSDKKRAEEELQRQRHRLVGAQALAHLGSWYWDIDNGEVQWSDELFRIFGHEPGSIHVTYDTFLASLIPDDHDRVLAAINDALAGKISYDIEYRIVRPNSEVRFIHACGDVHWDKTGRPLSMAGTILDITDSKRADAALRASEERYRALYDDTPTMYFTLATDGMVRSVNRFGAEQLGYQVEELIGHSVLGIFHEGDKESVAVSLSECLATPETTRHWEFRKIRKDGSIIWVRETARVGQSSTGETVVLVTCEDFTERRRMEEALRKSEQYNRILFESSPIGLVFCQLDGTIVDCNKKYANIMGRDRRDVLGKTYWELTSKKYDEQARAVMETVCCTGRFGPYEKEYIHADGHLVPVCLFGSLIEKDGELFIVCSVEDITERRRVEEELRKSHVFIRHVIDTDPNFIFAKDREGRFTLVNQAVADTYGSTVEDLVGKTDADFNPNVEEVALFRKTDLEVMDFQQERFIAEELITDAHGNRRWLQTVKRPLLDAHGLAHMVLGAASDITERKRIEETLHQRERDLRAAIEEREQISQDLHDGILQSLFAVGLALETTKSMMSPRMRKTSGSALNQAIDQLNRVMREIRNFIVGLDSDLLQGKDLSSALHRMLETLTKNHPTHVRLKVESRAAKAVSVEQSLHLFRVIQEAVSNCVRHGCAQEATVSLKMLKQGVRLSVRDNGRGFNPKAVRGTGHGLRNMAARAKKIGGRFTVLSQVNEGTRVVLDLPKETSDVSR
jgi:PAS domain S-box-containing protein